jgi:hypothetical protein
MGFKTDTIVIRPAVLSGGPDELLGHLGYQKRRRIKEAPFATSGGGSIWIGATGDCIVIDTHLASCFFDRFVDDPLDRDFVFLKNVLFRHFSEADIAAFTLNSVVDGWGFAVFRSGSLIRRYYGHDGSILGDEGSPLPSESAYLASCDRTEVDGEILYKQPDPRCEPVNVAYLGSALVDEVSRSFIGYPLDAQEIQRIPGAAFWLNDDEDKFGAMEERLPWWRLWG